jgi:hypothetical protein
MDKKGIGFEDVTVWTGFMWLRVQWLAVVNIVG